MFIRHMVLWLFSIELMVLGAGVVFGQNYPNKPIRVVTSAAGGGLDFAARQIALGLSPLLGQRVIVDNRPAAIAAEIVTQAPPDGYTLLFYSGTLWILPLLQNVPYDPVRDFSPISLTTSAPQILVVHPSLPAKSVKNLIALAKARPGELNYASGTTGSSNHIAAALFTSMAGVNIVRIPYKGGGPALIDLIAGQVQLMFATAASVSPHVKSNRLRALAVTSAQPSALLPGLPTVAASGVPGYEAVSVNGIFAPAKTSAAIISRLNQEIVRVLSQADVKEKFLSTGTEIIGSSPEHLAAAIKSEMARVGKVVKDAGIRAN